MSTSSHGNWILWSLQHMRHCGSFCGFGDTTRECRALRFGLARRIASFRQPYPTQDLQINRLPGEPAPYAASPMTRLCTTFRGLCVDCRTDSDSACTEPMHVLPHIPTTVGQKGRTSCSRPSSRTRKHNFDRGTSSGKTDVQQKTPAMAP